MQVGLAGLFTGSVFFVRSAMLVGSLILIPGVRWGTFIFVFLLLLFSAIRFCLSASGSRSWVVTSGISISSSLEESIVMTRL